MRPPERYSEDSPSSIRMRLEHAARYRFASRFAEGKEVLDLGAGTGGGTEAALRTGAVRVTALESSPEVLGELAIRFRAESRVIVKEGSAERIPLPDHSVDCVFFLEVIEHLPEPALAVKEVARVLREDGVLVLSTPAVRQGANPHHHHIFSRRELEALLGKEFPLVNFYSQGTILQSAIISSKGGEANLDPEALTPEYWVVLAGRSKLPEIPGVVSNLENFSDYEEQVTARLGADLRHVQTERDGLRSSLEALRGSVSWRFLQRIIALLEGRGRGRGK